MKNRVINEERLFNSIVSGALALCGLDKKIPVRRVGKYDYPACTDGKIIQIFMEHEAFAGLTGTDKLCACVGAVMHELGHILFTNFLVRASIASGGPRNFRTLLQDRPETWYNEGVAKLEMALEDYPKIWEMFWTFQNSAEDGYIEKAVSRVVRGKYAAWMRYFRRHLFSLEYSVGQLREKVASGIPEYYAIKEMMHQYVTSGRVKAETEAEKKDPALIRAGKALSDLDMASSHPDQLKRIQYAFAVLARYADDVIECAKQSEEDNGKASGGSPSESSPNADASGNSAGSKLAKKHFQDVVDEESAASEAAKCEKKSTGDKSEESKGSPAPGEDGNSENENSDSEETSSGLEEETPDEGSPEESSSATEASEEGDQSEEESTGITESETPKLDPVEHQNPGSSDEEDAPPKDIWEEEPRFLPTEGEAKEAEGSGEETVSESSLLQEDLASALSDLIEKLGSESSEPSESKDVLDDLRALNRSIPYADIHRGVDINIEKQVTTERHYDEWRKVKPEIHKIVSRCTKGVEKAIAERIRGGKKTGLMIGPHIDASRACRNDGKVFFNKRLPQKDLDVALVVLIDESGSMGGARILTAQTMSLVIHEVARKLKIPVGIYGHTTNNDNDVVITMYADMSLADEHGCARLMGVQARDCNRDGAALAFVMHRLQKRTERTKIIFMVCDGQPSASGYYGKEAEEDLRGIKSQIHRQKMSLVVAAIGDDKDAIERIYGDSFLDISQLEDLPQRLAKKLIQSINVR